MLRTLVILAIITYASSAVGFTRLISIAPEGNINLLLAITYSPFLVTFMWAICIAFTFFIKQASPIKPLLIGFGVNSVVFLGWLGVLLAQFSVFVPHV